MLITSTLFGLCVFLIKDHLADGSGERRVPGALQEFWNLSIPVPLGASKCILVSSGSSPSVLARLSHVNGRREIQVIHFVNSEWRFMGRNGEAITGVSGNFLMDARQGPDHRLWVLAGYSDVSNRDRGSSYYLYQFDGISWILHSHMKLNMFSFFGLRFTPDGQPLLHYSSYKLADGGSKDVEAEHFVPAGSSEPKPNALERLVQNHPGLVAWCDQGAWHVSPKREGQATVLCLRWIGGNHLQDVGRPIEIMSWNRGMVLRGVAATSDGSSIAVLASPASRQENVGVRRLPGESEWNEWEYDDPSIAVLSKASHAEFACSILPKLPISTIGHVSWSPKNQLHLVGKGGSDMAIRVFGFEGSKWLQLWEQVQDVGQRRSWNPIISFGEKSRPIVIWDKMFIH